jgi:pimeloyl-ACP methyl ester carboxylesterase
VEERIRRQRVRLERAEAQTFTHYRVAVDPAFLSLTDPEVTVRVLRCGEGPPAVLLHGGGMTAAVWAPLLPHLPGRSLYLLDLPGCGLSDPFDYTGVDVVAHQQAFVGSLLDALGLSQTALIGSSLGGMYALRFARSRRLRRFRRSRWSAPRRWRGPGPGCRCRWRWPALGSGVVWEP